MSQLSLEVVGGMTQFLPGAPIEVDAAWTLDAQPEAIELRIIWNTSGWGGQDFQLVDTVRIEAPSPVERRRIPLTLPREPYSFHGSLITIQWGLELVTLPSNDAARLEIKIALHPHQPKADHHERPKTERHHHYHHRPEH